MRPLSVTPSKPISSVIETGPLKTARSELKMVSAETGRGLARITKTASTIPAAAAAPVNSGHSLNSRCRFCGTRTSVHGSIAAFFHA